MALVLIRSSNRIQTYFSFTLFRVNGDPPIALHTSEEICNCKWFVQFFHFLSLNPNVV